MTEFRFPSDSLTFRDPSFEPLHQYTRGLSAIRRALTPPQRHWAHASLRVTASGLTTTAIPYENAQFEIALDFIAHCVRLETSRGDSWHTRLHGQPGSQFWQELIDALAAMNIQPNATRPNDTDVDTVYDAPRIENFFHALSRADVLLKRFQGELRGETSPVQFWSHHFDLAMLWFSGRLVPDPDPNDKEKADEQMNFGLSPGDTNIPEPYFYVTAYPTPDGWLGGALPDGAEWYKKEWQGALLMYKNLAAAPHPDSLLMDFWRSTHTHGAELMR